MVQGPQESGVKEAEETAEFSASVVVPAHMERIALPRQLESLLEQDLGSKKLHVIVVVNGSTDGTANAARSYVPQFAEAGHLLEVIEISTASKAAALNTGDQATSTFPRLYLDADITLSNDAVSRTIDVLRAVETPLLAAPQVDVGWCSGIATRHYGHIWSRLPYIREQVPGVGFYAVNEEGRKRWWRFPTRLGADDKFVRLQFGPGEVTVVDDASFTVYLPEKFLELLKVRGRWIAFNRDLARRCPGLAATDTSRWRSSIRFLMRSPNLWHCVPLFLLVWVGAWASSLLSAMGYGERWARASSSKMRAGEAADHTAENL